MSLDISQPFPSASLGTCVTESTGTPCLSLLRAVATKLPPQSEPSPRPQAALGQRAVVGMGSVCAARPAGGGQRPHGYCWSHMPAQARHRVRKENSGTGTRSVPLLQRALVTVLAPALQRSLNVLGAGAPCARPARTWLCLVSAWLLQSSLRKPALPKSDLPKSDLPLLAGTCRAAPGPERWP